MSTSLPQRPSQFLDLVEFQVQQLLPITGGASVAVLARPAGDVDIVDVGSGISTCQTLEDLVVGRAVGLVEREHAPAILNGHGLLPFIQCRHHSVSGSLTKVE